MSPVASNCQNSVNKMLGLSETRIEILNVTVSCHDGIKCERQMSLACIYSIYSIRWHLP